MKYYWELDFFFFLKDIHFLFKHVLYGVLKKNSTLSSENNETQM